GARRSLDGSERATRVWLSVLLAADVRDTGVRSRLIEGARVSVPGISAFRDDLLGEPPWDVEARLGDIRCPALVIAGARDAEVPRPLPNLLPAQFPPVGSFVLEPYGGSPSPRWVTAFERRSPTSCAEVRP